MGSEKKVGIKLEANFVVYGDRASGTITIQQMKEGGLPTGLEHSEALTANGSPEMAAMILGGRLKKDFTDALWEFTNGFRL